jgi:hypothetical protein
VQVRCLSTRPRALHKKPLSAETTPGTSVPRTLTRRVKTNLVHVGRECKKSESRGEACVVSRENAAGSPASPPGETKRTPAADKHRSRKRRPASKVFRQAVYGQPPMCCKKNRPPALPSADERTRWRNIPFEGVQVTRLTGRRGECKKKTVRQQREMSASGVSDDADVRVTSWTAARISWPRCVVMGRRARRTRKDLALGHR